MSEQLYSIDDAKTIVNTGYIDGLRWVINFLIEKNKKEKLKCLK